MSYSIRSYNDPDREIGVVSEQKLSDIIDPASEHDSSGARWRYQQERDERLFEAAWFADFRQQFRNALTDARIAGRLNQLEV